MKKFRNLTAVLLLSALAVGLGSCTAQVIPPPDHKAKTTACLIRSEVLVPGTPEKQLAADLVEAKIVNGLAVRDILIAEDSEQVPARLLQALQAGCVLMVSANTDYILPLANFAKVHANMLVLFVGGEIKISSQPSNFRWVADDIQGGARLAGFFAAGKSESARVHLFIQDNYFASRAIRTAFRAGVADFDKSAETTTETVILKSGSPNALKDTIAALESTEVMTIFAGRSLWKGLATEQTDGPFLMGADLQLGQSAVTTDSRVKVSVERNTSTYVLNAAANLLDRKFDSEPLHRRSSALKLNTVELRVIEPDSIDGRFLEALSAYRSELIASSNR
jgi:basic membrane lipoprotein Med (substrate-binding protein (PBP1-ABC) superfamily)